MRLFMTPVTFALLFLLAACDTATPDAGEPVTPVSVVLETTAGTIELDIYPDRAPLSAGSFLAFVYGGHLDGGGSR